MGNTNWGFPWGLKIRVHCKERLVKVKSVRCKFLKDHPTLLSFSTNVALPLFSQGLSWFLVLSASLTIPAAIKARVRFSSFFTTCFWLLIYPKVTCFLQRGCETQAHSWTHLWLLWTLLGLYEGWYADPHAPLGWSRDSPEVRGAIVVKAFVKSKGRRRSPSPGIPAVSYSPRSPHTGRPWTRCQPEVYSSHWPLE